MIAKHHSRRETPSRNVGIIRRGRVGKCALLTIYPLSLAIQSAAARLAPGGPRRRDDLKNRTEGNLSDEKVPNADDIKRETVTRASSRCDRTTRQIARRIRGHGAPGRRVRSGNRRGHPENPAIRRQGRSSNERRAAEETARANDLARQLDDERRRAPGSRTNSRAFVWRRSNVRRRRSAPWRCNRRTKVPPPCCGARLRRSPATPSPDAGENPAGQPAAALVRPHGRFRDKGGPPRLEMGLRLRRMGDAARHRAMEMAEKRGHEVREQEISGAGGRESFSHLWEKVAPRSGVG